MSSMFRIRSVCLVLVLCLALLWAAPGVAKTRIQHLHDTNNGVTWTHWTEEAKKRFEEQNPGVEIEVLAMGRTQLLERVVTLWAANLLPDVVEVAPEQVYEFMKQGLFQDLNPYMEKDPNLKWEEFFPLAVRAVTEGGTSGGKRWLLPGSVWVIGAAFNVDLFNEAGVDLPLGDEQWTWSDFAATAKKLTVSAPDGQITRYGACIPRSWARWPVWVHNAGGFFLDSYFEPTRSQLLDPPVRTALQFLQDAYQTDRFASWNDAYNAGRTPITFEAGPSRTPLLVEAGATFEFAYGPYPRLVRGGSEIQILGWSLSARTENPDVSWRWMRFLATDMASDHIRFTGRPPAWRTVAARYQSLVKYHSPWEHVWVRLIEHPDTYPRAIYEVSIRDTLQRYINIIFEGRQDVDSTLEQAHQVISAMLQEKIGSR